jgi:SAM-dependent methyltransferase
MSLSHPCHGLAYSLRRYVVDQYYLSEVASLAAGRLILDLGGTKVGKRGVFNIDSFDHQVINLNISPLKSPDLLGNAASLPFGNNTFDVVICSELLEHVHEPIESLIEIYRVLKPDGVLLATIPFIYPHHPDPNDYLRYTEQFLQLQMEMIGYTQIAIETQGGFWSVFADMVRAIVYEWHSQPGFTWRINRFLPLTLLSNCLKTAALRWDAGANSFHTVYCRGMTTGFGIKAHKPAFE